MVPIFFDQVRYRRAVRDAADGLVRAHGRVADQEAWRAARLPNLTRSERAFCEAVAMRVSRLLGLAPTGA
jgi:hypothetical protein